MFDLVFLGLVALSVAWEIQSCGGQLSVPDVTGKPDSKPPGEFCVARTGNQCCTNHQCLYPAAIWVCTQQLYKAFSCCVVTALLFIHIQFIHLNVPFRVISSVEMQLGMPASHIGVPSLHSQFQLVMGHTWGATGGGASGWSPPPAWGTWILVLV